MNSRLKLNQEIRDVVAFANNRKGRSKSRRANPHKTIDGGEFMHGIEGRLTSLGYKNGNVG